MSKLLRPLNKYGLLIIIILILVAISSVASLYLPDRMAVILGEGITTQGETTEDGENIYIDISAIASLLPDNLKDIEIILPKIKYENAGKLVTIERNGKHYAKIVGVEKDSNGNIIMFNAYGESKMPLPIFLRTEDGTENTAVKQGTVVLDELGFPFMETRQVSNMKLILQNGLIMLAIVFVSAFLSIIVMRLSANVSMNYGKDIRKKLFHKIANFSMAEEDKFGTSSLITRSTSDINQVQTFVMVALRQMINVPVMFIGGMLMAYSKDPKMTNVIFIVLPIVLIFFAFMVYFVVPKFKKMQLRVDDLTLVSRENINGIRVIRAFGGQEKEKRKFANANKNITDLGTTTARIMSGIFPFASLLMSGTVISIMIIGTMNINGMLQNQNLDFKYIANMMAVIQYIMQIMMAVIMLAFIFIMVPKAVVSAKRITEVLNTKNSVKDKEEIIEKELKGNIEFKDVSFAYDGTKEVLKNINFKAEVGKTTAIIGSTGSSKSTLINLIPRLYDVSSGEVTIDGINVKDLKQDALRDIIGFAPQKAILLKGTIKDNITYGSKNDSLENAIESAKIACAYEFILNKENQFEEQVEQGGTNFSGGQKQRVSIARAIARKPKIYIFDDSFSALDFKTDKEVRTNLKEKLQKDTTQIIVAQRIGSVMDADNILVMEKGEIIAQGKHEDLIKNCQIYQDIALSQLSMDELQQGGTL